MKPILTPLLLAGTLLALSPAFAQQPVHITSLNFNGTGCINNKVDATGKLYDLDNDNLPDQFEILFSSYIAQQGAGVALAERRKNCNISVGLFLPQGWQFSIADVVYLGFADLPRGVTGTQRSDYEFIFQTGRVRLQSVIPGPLTDNYRRQDALGIESVVWSKCGVNAPLSIRSEVFLSGNATLPASMTLDQVTGKVSQIFGLRWRRCTS